MRRGGGAGGAGGRHGAAGSAAAAGVRSADAAAAAAAAAAADEAAAAASAAAPPPPPARATNGGVTTPTPDNPDHPRHEHHLLADLSSAAAHALPIAPIDRPPTAEAEAAALRHPTLSARKRWAMTCLFAVQAALLYADQNLLAPNLSAAAADFGLDDAQKDAVLGGALMACFFLVGAPAALIVGYLADRVRRVRLLFIVVAIGAVPCLAVYWARTIPAFFALRALTGVSVGGCFPLVFSLLGDLFPSRRRAATSALVQIATGAGLAAGQAIAGTVGQPDALGWRAPFVIAAVPALALNLFMLLVCPEPPRGAFEKAALQREKMRRVEERRRRRIGGVVADGVGEDAALPALPPAPRPPTVAAPKLPRATATTPTTHHPHPHRRHHHHHRKFSLNRLRSACLSAAQSTKQVLSVPSNALVVLQGLPGCLPWGVMLTYMNDFLARQKGLSVREATMVLLVFGLSGGAGVLAGGAGGQWLYNRRKEALAVFSGAAVLLGIAPVLWLVNADLLAAGVPAVAAAAAAAGAVASVPGPCMRAVMLNVNPPGVRGAALALQSLTDDLGKGVGPVVVAALIGSLGGSRVRAFNLAVIGWVPCGMLILALVFTMRRDETRAQEALAAAVRERRVARRRRERRAVAAASGADLERGGGEDGGPSSQQQQVMDEDELDELELELELELGTEDDEDDLEEEGEEEEDGVASQPRSGNNAAATAPPEVALTTSPRALEATAAADAAAAGSCCSRSSVDSDRALLLADDHNNNRRRAAAAEAAEATLTGGR